MLLTTPNTIRTLQRKLYAKAKQDIAGWFALNSGAGSISSVGLLTVRR